MKIIRARKLIDGVRDLPRLDQAVLVDGIRIVAVGDAGVGRN